MFVRSNKSNKSVSCRFLQQADFILNIKRQWLIITGNEGLYLCLIQFDNRAHLLGHWEIALENFFVHFSQKTNKEGEQTALRSTSTRYRYARTTLNYRDNCGIFWCRSQAQPAAVHLTNNIFSDFGVSLILIDKKVHFVRKNETLSGFVW